MSSDPLATIQDLIELIEAIEPFDSSPTSHGRSAPSLRTFDAKMACHERTFGSRVLRTEGESNGGEGGIRNYEAF